MVHGPLGTLPVVLGNGGRTHLGIREIDTLVTANASPQDHLTDTLISLFLYDLQRDGPVIDKHPMPHHGYP